MVRAGITLLAVLLTAGCADDTSMAVDGGADGSTPGSASLVFAFVPDPAVPGPTDAEPAATIERAEILLEEVRAIGDSAPGDDRTTRMTLALRWDDEQQAPDLEFPLAPPGIYSQLSARIVEYEIRGTVLVDQTEYPFEIEDELLSSLSLNVPLDGLEVRAGAPTRVEIDVAFGLVVDAVDWAEADDESGVLVVESDSAQIDDLRSKLLEAIGNARVVE